MPNTLFAYDLNAEELAALQTIKAYSLIGRAISPDVIKSIKDKLSLYDSAGAVFQPTEYRATMHLVRPNKALLEAFTKFVEAGQKLELEDDSQ